MTSLRSKIQQDLIANLAQRRGLIKLALGKLAVQKKLRELCAQDIVFFTSLFVWQFNPREKRDGIIGPFIAWDNPQAEMDQVRVLDMLVWCVDNDEDILLEKSRQMGASWMMVILFVWYWLFRPNSTLLMISRDELMVDSKKPASLFWKIDFILKYLPDWMMPRKWQRTKLFFGNNDNGATIFGESSTGKSGVGATLTAMAVDEFSQIEEDYEVLHRTSDAAGCRIFNGTHRGLDTALFELSKRVDFRKLVLHWSQHPKRSRGSYRFDAERNQVVPLDLQFPFPPDYVFVRDGSPTGGPFPGLRSVWYDKEVRRKGDDRAVAMDLDINPQGSVQQFFNAIVIHALKVEYCCEPFWQGDISYDPDTGQPVDLVKVPGGPLKLWCHLDASGRPPKRPYKFGADISTGQGRTPSCLSGVDGVTGEKVLQYTNNALGEELFATVCVALCQWFQDESGEGAYFAWEKNGPGGPFGKRVLELQYANIYYYAKDVPDTIKTTTSYAPGWFNEPQGLHLMLSEYRSALHSRLFVNRDEEALLECLDYKWNKAGRLEHSGSRKENDPAHSLMNHGDHVIADALACKLLKPWTLKRRHKEEVKKPGIGSLGWRRMLAEVAAQSEDWR